MQNNEKAIGLINDLIELNNDRIAGFEKALSDIDDEDVDLKALFQDYATQSRKYTQELTVLVANYGGEVETGTSVAGTLHRVWIDVKALFGGSDRVSILSEAERGEDAIKKGYETAVRDGSIPTTAMPTLIEQLQGVQFAHDNIKVLRDAAKAMS